jgi:cytochrome c-type biogenesis protein CcmH
MTLRVLLASLAFLATATLAAQQPGGTAPAQADPRGVVGPPKGEQMSGNALDTRTVEVSALLRCPVCQGLSVGDSPSDMALKMKAEVREMLASGYEQGQILAYFEHSYGEFVLLRPPLRGVNWLVWLAPLLGLAGGTAVVTWALRRAPRAAEVQAPELSSPPASLDLPGQDTLPDDPRLASYVLEVRELAYGRPSLLGGPLRRELPAPKLRKGPPDGNHGR